MSTVRILAVVLVSVWLLWRVAVVVFRLTFSRSPASAAARADDAVNRLEPAKEKIEPAMMSTKSGVVFREYLRPPRSCQALRANRRRATALCLLLAAPAFGCVATAPLAPRLLMRRSSRLVAVAGAGAPKPAALKPSALKGSARMSPAQAATLTVPKLKAELSELGLPTSGLKAVLLERLQAALSEPAAAPARRPCRWSPWRPGRQGCGRHKRAASAAT